MHSFPIYLKLKQQPCLIIGGGQVALRKARLLTQAGAVVTVLAPQITPDLHTLITQHQGYILKQTYPCQLDLSQFRLVYAATDDVGINAQIFNECEAKNILVNSVDDPPHCRFTTPAIIDRSPLLITVATGGNAPVIARQLRTQLESTIPARMGDLVAFSGQWRQRVKQQLPNPDTRRIFWENVYASSVGEAVLAGNIHIANAAMLGYLKNWQPPQGEVYLVGAGCGDPELLTFKALRLMQQADVVLYDKLVSAPILELVRRDAQRIYVGKARANHSMPQGGINQLLVDLAKQGKRVCRLKGGDPFIFGRGGEELQTLADAGVSFQVVPGITAASGCASYAGIPLTHRDYAQSVRFLTGHLKAGSPELPWQELVYEQQTLVIYMSLVGLGQIMQKLMQHGLRSDMPVALVSKGTLPEQQVVVGTVATIAKKVVNQNISAPTLTIVGDVVKLRDKLQWFDKQG